MLSCGDQGLGRFFFLFFFPQVYSTVENTYCITELLSPDFLPIISYSWSSLHFCWIPKKLLPSSPCSLSPNLNPLRSHFTRVLSPWQKNPENHFSNPYRPTGPRTVMVWCMMIRGVILTRIVSSMCQWMNERTYLSPCSTSSNAFLKVAYGLPNWLYKIKYIQCAVQCAVQ